MTRATEPNVPPPSDRRAAGDDFEFTSAVDGSLRTTVESLFFFNPAQPALIESIRKSVEEFGVPQIVERGDRICLGIPARDAQCLFACDRAQQPPGPVGVVLYLRTTPHLLRILHLAVSPAYADDGPLFDRGLALRLVDEVRALGRRISGVRRIQLPYRARAFLSVVERGEAPRGR
ncbi:MAG: hypothetical protein JSW36_08455 [Burkholderiales bacterium]|nr:MAG: hypothetical protein JSW36_08455 [Burkholderiales bacterium]